MNLKNFYPLQFDGSRGTFDSFIKTLFIKANYDSLLKRVTGYKGMHPYSDNIECWTLKFDATEGIYGLVQSSNSQKENFYESTFDLYYFPSPNEKNLHNSSLMEEYIANSEDFIEKIKGFSSFLETYLNFKIAKIILNISKKGDFLKLKYESLHRIKTYSKDGVKDIMNLSKREYILLPHTIDKNFPAFRYMIPFFTFFNTLVTRISKTNPTNFSIEKRKVNAVYYDKKGIQSKKKDSLCTKLTFTIDYSKHSNTIKNNSKHKMLFSLLKSDCWLNHNLDISNIYLKNNKKSLKPRFIVVTGFLGSGKTNFLQNFIEFENQNSRFVGIIQNEIGKTGLDSKLIDYKYNMVDIDEGCVCCSLAGQLKSAINKLMEKNIPDTILLETTGVANPFNLLSEIDELSDLVEFDSIVTIVDAKSYDKLISSYSIFKDQIRSADVILLNKIDLISKEKLAEIKKKIQVQNRCVNIIDTIRCSINPLEVINSASLSDSTSHISTEFNEETTIFRTHLEDKISSVKKSMKTRINRLNFEKYLKKLPSNILRLKGIVQFEGSNSQFIIQYVNGDYEINPLEGENKKENFLIYIGTNMENFNRFFKYNP